MRYLQTAAELGVKQEKEMTIIVKLKFFYSVLLICCLLLPLSQCTTSDKQGTEAQSEKVIETQYAFKSPKEIGSWLNVLALMAPFAMFFATRKSPPKIKTAVGFLLFSGAALYVIFSLTLWSEKILLGGYLAYASSISLVLLALIELWSSFRHYLKAKSA